VSRLTTLLDHYLAELKEHIVTTLDSAIADLQAADAAVDAVVADLTAKLSAAEAELSAASNVQGVSDAQIAALEAVIANLRALIPGPVVPPVPVPSLVTVPDQSFTAPLGAGVEYQIVTDGGTAPYTFQPTAGLPAGLSNDANGVVTGVVAASGTSTATVNVSDATGAAATGTLTVTIA